MTLDLREQSVAIVGGGPAGLSAACELRQRGIGRVVVLEREKDAGGIPRHSDHQGYGLRDLHRSMTGPRYARTLVRSATRLGVEIETSTTVLSIEPGVISTTGINGPRTFATSAILLATGARERPRSARLVPGDRPSGIFTTGQLQQWAGIRDLPIGKRALVVGAEHVSFSAMLTLRHSGTKVVGLTTELEQHQSYGPFALMTRHGFRVPILTSTRVTKILGRSRVTHVELESLVDSRRWTIEVDTVVFTGDWIPDHELSREAKLTIDPGTKGPATDALGRTSHRGIYAAGNLAHPVETADLCAVRARQIAGQLARDLLGHDRDQPAVVAVNVDKPILWAWPNRIVPGDSPASISLRSTSILDRSVVHAVQDGEVIGTTPLWRAIPNRHVSISGEILDSVQPDAGPIALSIVPAS